MALSGLVIGLPSARSTSKPNSMRRKLINLEHCGMVGVDDGGLALEATHNEKSIAYVEIGGITSMLCDDCGSAVTEIVGCPKVFPPSTDIISMNMNEILADPMKTPATTGPRIEKLACWIFAGDWHDKPLRWSVVWGSKNQLFSTKKNAERYARIWRRCGDELAAIHAFQAI
jgi:hypothetical protein